MADALRVWCFGCAHVIADLRHGRESLADAIRDSEQWEPTWDIAINIGDLSSAVFTTPDDEEGRVVVRQLGVLRRHRREQIYSVCGNHDRSGRDDRPADWWRRWVDPLGEHPSTSGIDPSERPYPIEGTWERYSFRVGNLLFLMMSDIIEPTQKLGREVLGGNPGGVVSQETFAWWREMVEGNPESIIISAHHYMLRDTTVASGAWEGMRKDDGGNWRPRYHGYHPQGTPQGASYLYYVGSVPDAGAFEGYLERHPGRVALWIGGHTHAHPDDTHGGKSHVETKWGTNFINASCLTRHHGVSWFEDPGQAGSARRGAGHCVPHSRLLTFTEGRNEASVQCYLHTGEFLPKGWHSSAERTLGLGREVRLR